MKSENRILIFSAIALLMLVGIVLRLHGLTSLEPIGDEYAGVLYAKLPIHEIISGKYDPYHPFLYFTTLHFIVRWFDDGLLTARWLSFAAGILTIPMLFFFASLLFDEAVGIMAAFLLALSVPHITWSVYARMYSLLTFFTISTAFTGTLLVTKNRRSDRILFIISSFILFHIHYYGPFFFTFLVPFILLSTKGDSQKNGLRNFALAVVAILLLFIPQAIILTGQHELVRRNWQDVGEGLEIVINTIYNFLPHDPSLRDAVIVAFLFSLFQKGKPGRKTMGLLIPTVLPIPAAYLFSKFVTPIYWDRYLIPVIPFFFIAVAAGYVKAVRIPVKCLSGYKRFPGNLYMLAIMSVSLFWIAGKSDDSRRITEQLNESKAPFRLVASFIESFEFPEHGCAVVITPEPMPFRYLLDERKYSIMDIAGRSRNLMNAELWKNLLKQPCFDPSDGRFWLVFSKYDLAENSSLPMEGLLEWEEKNCKVIETREIGVLRVHFLRLEKEPG